MSYSGGCQSGWKCRDGQSKIGLLLWGGKGKVSQPAGSARGGESVEFAQKTGAGGRRLSRLGLFTLLDQSCAVRSPLLYTDGYGGL